MKRDAILLWTRDGVWLQTWDNGAMRSSYCGRISLESVTEFAGTRGMTLHVVTEDRRTISRRECATAQTGG